MRILSVDTSAVCASVAVVEDGRIRAQSSTNAGLTHSRTLLPMIDSLLQNSETPLDSIDCFACAVGPGSFTGIRIGIAAIKGLCDGTGKQALAVSTLEGLAYNLLRQDTLACAVMDARCNQVYTALFEKQDGELIYPQFEKALKVVSAVVLTDGDEPAEQQEQESETFKETIVETAKLKAYMRLCVYDKELTQQL